MSRVEAIYRHGVFEPLHPVDLPEGQRVQLSIAPVGDPDIAGWLQKARQIQEKVLRRRGGPLPDSTPDIAADRLR